MRIRVDSVKKEKRGLEKSDCVGESLLSTAKAVDFSKFGFGFDKVNDMGTLFSFFRMGKTPDDQLWSGRVGKIL